MLDDIAIDNVRHGWALLAMRLPDIRPLAGQVDRISDLCECYSAAVLHLEKLRRHQASVAAIEEYEDICLGIEQEVRSYLYERRLSK